jgi:hypothetical protein
MIAQKRSIAADYKQGHHGEYWTAQQGLYPVSKTTDQGIDRSELPGRHA